MKNNSFVSIKKLTQVSLALCLSGSLTCVATDTSRENVFATDIQQGLNLGNAVWLEADGKNF